MTWVRCIGGPNDGGWITMDATLRPGDVFQVVLPQKMDEALKDPPLSDKVTNYTAPYVLTKLDFDMGWRGAPPVHVLVYGRMDPWEAAAELVRGYQPRAERKPNGNEDLESVLLGERKDG